MNKNISDKSQPNMTTERLNSLYELIGRMNSVYELQELLEFVVDRALSLTNGSRGVLLLGDDSQQEPNKVAVVRGKELSQKDLEQTLSFISTTIIKDVLNQGEPRLVNDLLTDQRYEKVASDTTLHFKRTRSVLAVPLKIDEQLVGLLYIDHPRQAVFGQGDLDFLSAFASQAALAINRAREFQREIEELTLLNELSRSVVQVLDLDEVLTRIVHEAARMLKVETGSVILADEATGELFFAISISQGQRINIPTRLQKGQGIAGWVIETGQAACVNTVNNHKHWFGEVETGFTTRSLLSVPLQLEERILGTLQVLNKKSPLGFTPDDITRLSAFAASATIAIENARLFREASQAQQLRALNEAALALSSSLNLETILNVGLEHALNILKTDAGCISLIDTKEMVSDSTLQVSRGLSDDPALAQRQCHTIRQLTGDINHDDEEAVIIDRAHLPNNDDLALINIEALALVPIKVGKKVWGTLGIIDTTPHTYSPDEIDVLINLARIIGLAVQNATYYNQVSTQAMHLTHFNEVGSALTSSLDLDYVLQVILEGVNSLLETERTSIFLIDDETNELVLSYSNDRDSDIRLPAPWEGIAGWVAAHDQPALVNDTLSDPRHLQQIAIETGYAAQSILCVPLKVEGQVIGVVEVLNKTGDHQQFNHYHQDLLVELTKWAAIAIHNARLFDQRVQAYQHLSTEQQRRIAAETRAAMAAVILDMAHTMNNVVGAIRVWASSIEFTANKKPQTPVGQFEKKVGQIRENAEEAIKLISTMTDPLRQATIAPTDVHACLAAAIKSCWWPDNIELSKQYGDNLPLVQANAKRLEAVFHNLISNAVQAIAPDDGRILLRTRTMPDGWVEITLADNGPGIPTDLQESIFNPGVSGRTEGLGIGLWLVETFVHQFDGNIDFTSEPDKGTTFAITLQPVQK